MGQWKERASATSEIPGLTHGSVPRMIDSMTLVDNILQGLWFPPTTTLHYKSPNIVYSANNAKIYARQQNTITEQFPNFYTKRETFRAFTNL
jgi:hypothetical protein